MANKNAAKEDELGEVHSKVASLMTNVLDNYNAAAKKNRELIEAAVPDADPAKTKLVAVQEPSPAFLNAVTKFLKDNEVTAASDEGAGTDELAKALDQNRKNRGKVVGLADIPLEGSA